MPAKSRRNRRNISQGPKTTINRSVATAAVAAPAETVLPGKTVNTNNLQAKTAVVEDSISFVATEIKWIGVVTAIVIVILVILYVFLR